MTALLAARILPPRSGLPLDDALETMRDAADAAREEARTYFQATPRAALDPLRERFTFLFPPEVQEKFGLGVPVALSPSAIAVRYQRLLWKQYIDRFTRVEEAPGRDPDSLRFKVSLDLRLFCKYRQEARDLVSR
jgi:hypothetical protein